MKCTYCGNELKGKSRCEYCGKAASHTEEDIQVEYKEFPVSEYLEIRKKFKQPMEGDIQEGLKSATSSNHMSASGKQGRGRKGIRKQDITIIFIAILIGFLAISGLVYWLRFIYKSLF